MSVLTLVILLAVIASLAMACAWFVAERTGQSGWADAVWSLTAGFLGILAALIPLDAVQPYPVRQILVALLAAFWSLRLGGHIVARTKGRGDDPRYAELRKQWGSSASARLFWFLQIQAFVALVLGLCIGLAAHNPAPSLRLADMLGIVIILVAVIGEWIADRQMERFRSEPKNRGKVCDRGLWALSRHPNYFFEWLGWLAYLAIAADPGGPFLSGWLALAGPVLMYVLLVYVSGIPPLEQHMMRSRGNAFRAYQKRVSAFWPLPSKPAAGQSR